MQGPYSFGQLRFRSDRRLGRGRFEYHCRRSPDVRPMPWPFRPLVKDGLRTQDESLPRSRRCQTPQFCHPATLHCPGCPKRPPAVLENWPPSRARHFQRRPCGDHPAKSDHFDASHLLRARPDPTIQPTARPFAIRDVRTPRSSHWRCWSRRLRRRARQWSDRKVPKKVCQ